MNTPPYRPYLFPPTFSLAEHFKKYAANKIFNNLTFFELFQRANALKLEDEKAGQYFGIKSSDPLTFIIQAISLWLHGKTPVLLGPHTTPGEMQTLKNICPFSEALFLERDSQKHALSTPYRLLTGTAESLVAFTSGSTGTPKGVVHTFSGLFASAEGSNHFFSLGPKDSWGLTLPTHHLAGFMIFIRCLLAGAAVTDDLTHSSFISLVPTQLYRMMEAPSSLKQLQNKKTILIGGAKLSPTLLQQALDLGLGIVQSYGMSETCSHIWCTQQRSSKGEILPYRKMKIDREKNILVGGDILCKGYFQKKKFTPLPLINGYFKTSDCGTLQGHQLQIHHRTDGQFISGGENISPDEIVQQAKKYQGILQAYLVPLPHQDFGHIGFLFYESKSPIDEHRFKQFLKETLSPHKRPKFISPLLTGSDSTHFDCARGIKRDRNSLISKALSIIRNRGQTCC